MNYVETLSFRMTLKGTEFAVTEHILCRFIVAGVIIAHFMKYSI